MDINQIIITLLLLVLVGFVIYQLILYKKRKDAGIDLTKEEFSKDMRRVQIIDVREKADFDQAHILGARNIPLSQLKMRTEELRRDKPVYLYEKGEMFARQASLVLKKAGFDEIYRLEGGFEEWTGRTKSNI